MIHEASRRLAVRKIMTRHWSGAPPAEDEGASGCSICEAALGGQDDKAGFIGSDDRKLKQEPE
jgi:hypothetical protein